MTQSPRPPAQAPGFGPRIARGVPAIVNQAQDGRMDRASSSYGTDWTSGASQGRGFGGDLRGARTTAGVGTRAKPANRYNMSRESTLNSCYRCGYQHFEGEFCPAIDKTCRFCNKTGHFARVCRAQQRFLNSRPPTWPEQNQWENYNQRLPMNSRQFY